MTAFPHPVVGSLADAQDNFEHLARERPWAPEWQPLSFWYDWTDYADTNFSPAAWSISPQGWVQCSGLVAKPTTWSGEPQIATLPYQPRRHELFSVWSADALGSRSRRITVYRNPAGGIIYLDDQAQYSASNWISLSQIGFWAEV